MAETLARVLLFSLAMCRLSVAIGCEPFVEEHPRWASASLRPHTDAFKHCVLSESAYQSVIAHWLRSRPPGAAELTSLSLGRAVSLPWLSRLIANGAIESHAWAEHIESAGPRRREQLAAVVLGDPKLLGRLAGPFQDSPYEVVRLSFEKVLFGRADRYSSHPEAGAVPVPFDAQLWLRLRPRR